MLASQRLLLEQSERREKVNELLGKDELTGEERTELDTLTTRMQEIEGEYRAAVVVEAADLEAEQRACGVLPDAEMRERIQLRQRARVMNYLSGWMRGRQIEGAERELQEAAGVESNEIPLEIWDVPEERAENRTVASLPGTTGLNLAPVQNAVFAPSIAGRLDIDMPRVPTGGYVTATISTSQSASALAKGTAAAGVAGAMTAQSTTPHRISGRLELALEDIATVGAANFESALRQNLSMVMSDALDNFAINGTGSGANPGGLLSKLTDPTAVSTVMTFEDVVNSFANAIDGLWASRVSEVMQVVGVDTYKLAAKIFKSAIGTDPSTGLAVAPSQTAADWAMASTAGFWTNKRMPAAASDNQATIICRKGVSGMRKAVMPTWGGLSIDDPYTGSAKAERYRTVHVLVGDVLLVQPDAYAQGTFHLA